MLAIHSPLWRTGSTIFLQAVVVLFGLLVLTFLLWEPQVEGCNAHATQYEIYLKDPFLAYVYFASIPFFIALVQAFKILGYIRRNRIFSPAAVKALRTTKFCGLALLGFVAGGELFILLHDSDDRAGGVFMGVVFGLGSTIIATAAGTFERILHKAVEIQSENELTV